MTLMFNPTLTRRALIQKGAAATVILGAAGSMAACNVQEWINAALKDLPIVVQIALSIISMVGAASGSANAAEAQLAQRAADEAKRDLEAALQFVKDYESHKDPGLLGKIDDLLLTAQSNLGSILSSFHVGNQMLAATISAAIGSAITVIVAIQSLIPAPATATAARKKLGRRDDQTEPIKQAFNEVVSATGGAQYAIN